MKKEKKITEALEYFLGLKKRLPKKQEPRIKKLNELRSKLNVSIVKRSWNDLEKKIWDDLEKKSWDGLEKEIFENFLDEKSNKKNIFIPYLKRNYKLLLSFSLISIIVLGFFLFNKRKQENSIILTIHKNQQQPQENKHTEAYKKIDIQKVKFSEKDRMIIANINENLVIHSHFVENLEALQTENELNLNFSRGFILFKYLNKNSKRKLNISTADVRFEVVGTEFILVSEKNYASILVKKGRVLVHYNRNNDKKRIYIGSGKFWESDLIKSKSISSQKIVMIFKKFERKDFSKRNFHKLLDEKEQNLHKKKYKKVKIILESGEVISGDITSQDEKTLIIRTTKQTSFEIERKDISKILPLN